MIIKDEILDKYTKVPNQLIMDHNISHSAKIVYQYLSMLKNTWSVCNESILRTCDIANRNTLARIWKELMDYGYIKRTPSLVIRGAYDYHLLLGQHTKINSSVSALGATKQLENDDDLKPMTMSQYRQLAEEAKNNQ